LYVLRLCAYENEQQKQFNLKINNNRTVIKAIATESQGGLADACEQKYLHELTFPDLDVESETNSVSNYGHGLRHLLASDEELISLLIL
jgi:hypothetical protein